MKTACKKFLLTVRNGIDRSLTQVAPRQSSSRGLAALADQWQELAEQIIQAQLDVLLRDPLCLAQRMLVPVTTPHETWKSNGAAPLFARQGTAHSLRQAAEQLRRQLAPGLDFLLALACQWEAIAGEMAALEAANLGDLAEPAVAAVYQVGLAQGLQLAAGQLRVALSTAQSGSAAE